MRRANCLVLLVFILVSCLFVVDVKASTIGFTTVNVTAVDVCPLDNQTFVVAYHDEDNNDVSFQIYDTNGTQVLAETDVDTSVGDVGYTSVGVSAFNSTTFVIGWFDRPSKDATFAVYNKTGSLLSGPTDVDTEVGYESYSVQVSCFNSTYFVIGWCDYTDQDATFAIYTSSSTKIAGPTDVDTTVGNDCYSVSVSTFNSTLFVIGWYDAGDSDATFAVYDSAGTQIGSTIDADMDIGAQSFSVSVSTFNSTHFVMGWYDSTDEDATFAVYDSSGTLRTGPTDVDTTAGTLSRSVQVSVLNSTALVISWYDHTDFDLSFATYLSDGTVIAALTDIESWATAANYQFWYQSPCSQESGTGITIYGSNWVIAYSNMTTQAIWKTFYPNGTAWDGTIPSEGETRTWHSLTWTFDLVTRQWSHGYWNLDLHTRQWNSLSWMWTLITRAWSGQSWTFEIGGKMWNHESWTFDLVTRGWNRQSWTFGLLSKMWNPQYWTFDLLTRGWNQQSWTFDLTTRTWHGQSWMLDLLGRAWSHQFWSFDFIQKEWTHVYRFFNINVRQWNMQNWNFEFAEAFNPGMQGLLLLGILAVIAVIIIAYKHPHIPINL